MADKPLHFTLDGVEFAPFFEGTEDPTHAYVERVEPRVIFAGLDSGVANPARTDGTTLLDDVWAAAPFRTQHALIVHVKAVVEKWRALGSLTEQEAQRVVNAARHASF